MKLDDYVTEMSKRMATAWDCAREHIKKVQQKQKQHDKHARDPGFQLGDVVFVYMPASRQGEAYKFSKPLKAQLGLYHFVTMELT